ncbi:MAG: aspartate aminotransferase family protein [Pseudomonadota bacterium]
MTAILHRSMKSTLPVAVRGDGPYIIDSQGKRYLDASGGAAVSCLGHSHRGVTYAIINQAQTLAYAHTGFFTNQPAESLAHTLVDRAPDGFGQGRAIFLGSGSEAMEGALKLARQYHIERGQSGRFRLIAREGSYHGNTLGALAVGGHAGRRKPYAPLLIDVDHVPACYAYRHQQPGEGEEAFGLRMANALEEKLLSVGPETVAAFIAEPVSGATLGCVPPAPGYFRRIREICDTYDILFIADEVMCGMGRTGTLYAMEQEGVCPDIITIAKGLGAGYQPIAATLARQRVVEPILAGSRTLWNGHTYMSHAIAAAASLGVLEAIDQRDLLANVRKMGHLLQDRLHDRFGDHACVGDIRGRGLFIGLEIVADRETKQPFPADADLAARIKATAQQNGLLCYPASGCADGVLGDHIMIAPPFDIDAEHIDETVDVLEATIAECLPVGGPT